MFSWRGISSSKRSSPLFYLLDPRYGRLDALDERLLVQLRDQRLLDLGGKADLPGRFHFGGIGGKWAFPWEN